MIANSLFMVNAAKPMLILSTKVNDEQNEDQKDDVRFQLADC